jgi:Fe-S cluster biogenesis protein NfuA
MLVSEKTDEIVQKIHKVLEHIRPYLQQDGGDIELIGIKSNGVVDLRLLGACDSCPLKPMTLRAGIERAIMNAVPEIVRIECF